MKKWIGSFLIVLAIVPVVIFLGKHEFAFFDNTLGKDGDSYMSLFGYMMTGGGVFVWIGILLWHAKSGMQKAISFIMVGVCGVGSLAVALFNIYQETMMEAGFSLTVEEIKTMTFIVGVLATAHFLSLVMELAGEAIITAWQDDDGDGVPNIIDKDSGKSIFDLFKLGKNKPQPVSPKPDYQYQQAIAELQAQIEELKNPTKAGTAKE